MQPPPLLLVAPILLFIFCFFSRQRQKTQNRKERVKNFRTKLGISGHDQNFRTFRTNNFSEISEQLGPLNCTGNIQNRKIKMHQNSTRM